LETLVAAYIEEAKSLGGNIVVTGEPVMSAEVSRVVEQDSIYIVVTLLLLLLVIYFLTRSLHTTFATLLMCLFVLGVTYGVMGWFGAQLTPATSLVVFLLVPLSAAFVIHAHGYFVRRAEFGDPIESSSSAFLLAGLTTAIGFAFTGFTPAKDIQLLATMGVVGIAAATIGVFIITLPLLESVRNARFVFPITLSYKVLGNPVIGYSVLIFLLLIAVFGLSRIEFNYGPTQYLPDSNTVRADFVRTSEKFGRMNVPLMVAVEDVKDPAIWDELHILAERLETLPLVGQIRISWFYKQMASLSRALSLDEEGRFLPFPSSAEEFSQLLLLFDPIDVEMYFDQEQEFVLMMLQVPFEGSKDYFVLKEVVDDFFQSSSLDGHLVGRVGSFFETGHRLGSDTFRGLAIGGILIFFVLWILFGSFLMALVGIFVNALPVLAGVGVMGLLKIDIDMGSSIVAAVAFGIILDDSTHLLARVKRLVKAGYDPSTSVARSIRELAAPIFATTVAISVGFSVLLLAEMQPFNDFAIVILVTLVMALVSDLLLLPLLVRKFFPDPVK
jgi:predicted RND superfamily exporter protein